MMFQRMSFRAICHATEDEDKVRKALTNITKSEQVTRTKAEGYHGNPIIIFESVLSGKQLASFMKDLKGKGVVQGLGNKLDDRMDEECNLYMRFDKQKAYAGQAEVVEHEDVIAAKLKLRVFPPQKTTALSALKEYLEM